MLKKLCLKNMRLKKTKKTPQNVQKMGNFQVFM
jgi:hypothetical protein